MILLWKRLEKEKEKERRGRGADISVVIIGKKREGMREEVERQQEE